MKKLITPLLKKPKLVFAAATVSTLLMPATLMAQSATQTTAADNLLANDAFLWAILVLEGVLIVLSLVFVYAIVRLKSLMLKKEVAAGAEVAAKESLWEKVQGMLTDAAPLSKEKDILLDHDYDGIHELDNNLPPWWKLMFNAGVAFAVFYLGYWHFYQDGNVGENMYVAEMTVAEEQVAAYMAAQANSIDENNVQIVQVEESLLKGQKIYMDNCAACHGREGQGGVGPNVTDDYWIHGGSIQDIFKTVKYGVPQKGMISWQSKLSPSQMQDVSSYIYVELVGTTPPNPKDPQGDIYERSEEQEGQQAEEEGAEKQDNLASAQ